MRKARFEDVPAMEALISRSALTLLAGIYSEDQIRTALGPVFGVDGWMVQDSTYSVVEIDGEIVGCGGWSFREALFGGRSVQGSEPRCLDPATEAARVRAFFVDPDFARMGIGTRIMEGCEAEIQAHGFRQVEISATLAGEPLYRRFGFSTEAYYEILLDGAPAMKVARMTKSYGKPF